MVGINPQYGNDAYDYFYSHVYFDRLGSDYEAARDALTDDYRDLLLPYLRSFVGSLPGDGRLLDVGAGTGTWLALMREARPELEWRQVWALDPSRLACADLAQRFPGVEVECSTVETNGLPAEWFDLVLCSALIEHFTDPLAALFHLNRTMKRGGRLMMFTPSLDRDAFAYGVDRVFKFVHTFYFTAASLSAIAEKAGFRQVSIDRVAGDVGRLMWFPSLVGIYEKIADADIEQLESSRRPSPSDAASLEASRSVLASQRLPLLKHRVRQRFKTLMRRLLRARNSHAG